MVVPQALIHSHKIFLFHYEYLYSVAEAMSKGSNQMHILYHIIYHIKKINVLFGTTIYPAFTTSNSVL